MRIWGGDIRFSVCMHVRALVLFSAIFFLLSCMWDSCVYFPPGVLSPVLDISETSNVSFPSGLIGWCWILTSSILPLSHQLLDVIVAKLPKISSLIPCLQCSLPAYLFFFAQRLSGLSAAPTLDICFCTRSFWLSPHTFLCCLEVGVCVCLWIIST